MGKFSLNAPISTCFEFKSKAPISRFKPNTNCYMIRWKVVNIALYDSQEK